MILLRDYNENERIDRVWYDSSNVVYSECEDNKDDYKTLRVVFKTGDMYEYKDVDVKDYVMFIAGGTAGSNGKAFYSFIRSKGYECQKLGKKSLEEIAAEMQKIKETRASLDKNLNNEAADNEKSEK